MIFVVVMLVVMVVTFWCQERLGLCVCEFWPSIGGGDDVVLVVFKVVLVVIIVVICCCCDSFDHGEKL